MTEKEMTFEELKYQIDRLRLLVEQKDLVDYVQVHIEKMNNLLLRQFGEAAVREKMKDVNKWIDIRLLEAVDKQIDNIVGKEYNRQVKEFENDKSLQRGLMVAGVGFVLVELKNSIEIIRNGLEGSVKLGRYDYE